MRKSPAPSKRAASQAHSKNARLTRARKKELLAQAARSVSVPTHADICIVGAGAAGIVAATQAAEKNFSVVALDANVECAHTILATGNGRCNFTNIELGPAAFNAPEFVSPTLGERPLENVLSWFSACGLGWTQQEGRLYPRSLSAQSVRTVLMRRAKASGATLAPQRRVTHVSALPISNPYRFEMEYEECFADASKPSAAKSLLAKCVIIASGGGIASELEPLHIKTEPITPALCSLECEPTPFTQADGKRASAACTLWRDGVPLLRETGEVLFRSYGLSGISIFNLSRLAQAKDTITLDLLWELSPSEILKRNFDSVVPAKNLEGFLDPELARLIHQTAQADDLATQIKLAKNLQFTVVGLSDISHAQVKRGGLSLDAFDPTTLQSKQYPQLFACGEALDIDGACGGYNLSWAWLSGQQAAQNACSALEALC